MLLTLFGVCLGWLGRNLHQVNEREKLLRSVAARGALFGSIPPSGRPQQQMPFLWSLLGARPVGLIEVPDGTCSAGEFRKLTNLFPEARVIAGPVKFDPLPDF